MLVDSVFQTSINTPGELCLIECEENPIIIRRFWILFFRTLVYAAGTNQLEQAQHTKKAYSEYQKSLHETIKQALALADSLADLECLQEQHGFATETTWRDPIAPLTETLERYSQDFINPVYESLQELRSLQARYLNARYWPTIAQVIETLAVQLTKSEEGLLIPEADIAATLRLLIDECHWCSEPQWGGQLPPNFIKRLADDHIGTLIYHARDLEPPENIRSTINKALKKIR
ncbi:MAG: hypothetical protein Q8S52_01955 [Methylobacter sp.]|nr:hypothetical protein [Methylobacter sp.]MDP2429862.1 hypothetical protein [Methylobacter sp.]MDP3054780.1 hypothetical protein [Methylobacter sp.]MDP3360872.1 hypothetical protein [Methylobacter sp.]